MTDTAKRPVGRPRIYTDEQFAYMNELRRSGVTLREIGERAFNKYGLVISNATLRKILDPYPTIERDSVVSVRNNLTVADRERLRAIAESFDLRNTNGGLAGTGSIAKLLTAIARGELAVVPSKHA